MPWLYCLSSSTFSAPRVSRMTARRVIVGYSAALLSCLGVLVSASPPWCSAEYFERRSTPLLDMEERFCRLALQARNVEPHRLNDQHAPSRPQHEDQRTSSSASAADERPEVDVDLREAAVLRLKSSLAHYNYADARDLYNKDAHDINTIAFPHLFPGGTVGRQDRQDSYRRTRVGEVDDRVSYLQRKAICDHYSGRHKKVCDFTWGLKKMGGAGEERIRRRLEAGKQKQEVCSVFGTGSGRGTCECGLREIDHDRKERKYVRGLLVQKQKTSARRKKSSSPQTGAGESQPVAPALPDHSQQQRPTLPPLPPMGLTEVATEVQTGRGRCGSAFSAASTATASTTGFSSPANFDFRALRLQREREEGQPLLRYVARYAVEAAVEPNEPRLDHHSEAGEHFLLPVEGRGDLDIPALPGQAGGEQDSQDQNPEFLEDPPEFMLPPPAPRPESEDDSSGDDRHPVARVVPHHQQEQDDPEVDLQFPNSQESKSSSGGGSGTLPSSLEREADMEAVEEVEDGTNFHADEHQTELEGEQFLLTSSPTRERDIMSSGAGAAASAAGPGGGAAGGGAAAAVATMAAPSGPFLRPQSQSSALAAMPARRRNKALKRSRTQAALSVSPPSSPADQTGEGQAKRRRAGPPSPPVMEPPPTPAPHVPADDAGYRGVAFPPLTDSSAVGGIGSLSVAFTLAPLVPPVPAVSAAAASATPSTAVAACSPPGVVSTGPLVPVAPLLSREAQGQNPDANLCVPCIRPSALISSEVVDKNPDDTTPADEINDDVCSLASDCESSEDALGSEDERQIVNDPDLGSSAERQKERKRRQEARKELRLQWWVYHFSARALCDSGVRTCGHCRRKMHLHCPACREESRQKQWVARAATSGRASAGVEKSSSGAVRGGGSSASGSAAPASYSPQPSNFPRTTSSQSRSKSPSKRRKLLVKTPATTAYERQQRKQRMKAELLDLQQYEHERWVGDEPFKAWRATLDNIQFTLRQLDVKTVAEVEAFVAALSDKAKLRIVDAGEPTYQSSCPCILCQTAEKRREKNLAAVREAAVVIETVQWEQRKKKKRREEKKRNLMRGGIAGMEPAQESRTITADHEREEDESEGEDLLIEAEAGAEMEEQY